MSNKKKDCLSTTPVENHQSAAWIENWVHVKPNSNTLVPTAFSVENAKEWVDSNEL